MAEAVVKFGQTLLDITLEQYGTAEAAFSLLAQNSLQVGAAISANTLQVPALKNTSSQQQTASSLQKNGISSRQQGIQATSLTISQNSEANLLLTAMPVEGAVRYEFYRNTTNDFNTASRLGFSTDGTYTDVNYSTETEYFYFVLVANAVDISQPSESVLGIVPATPTLLTAEVVGSDNVLTWQDPSTVDEQQYVESGVTPTLFSEIATLTSGFTTYTDLGEGANTYFYRVRVSTTLNGSVFYSRYSNRALNRNWIEFSVTPLANNSLFYFSGNGLMRITSDLYQTIRLDYGDGTFFEDTDSRIDFPDKLYSDNSQRTVRFTFEDPAAVTEIQFNWIAFTQGQSFPDEILIFSSLQRIILNQCNNAFVSLNPLFLDLQSLLRFGTANSLAGLAGEAIPEELLNKSLTELSWGESELGQNVAQNGIAAARLDRISTSFSNSLERLLLTAQLNDLPSNFDQLVNLQQFSFQMGNGNGIMPTVVSRMTSLLQLEVLRCTQFQDLSGLVHMRSFAFFSNIAPTAMPTGWWNWDFSTPGFFLRCDSAGGVPFADQARSDDFIANIYNDVSQYGQIANGNGTCRNVTMLYSQNANPSGTYQQPASFVLGSSNGTPASPQEMLWVLVNQYNWTLTL